ncbi:MAG: hypothetical protein COU35_04150 [Candidatus Magasanikbacteria bacterium CG10_big_fil_rev_8_21_14_0_10_47_10]|uniref:Galactosyldiacylglycerol synthase n=1 Tax=Candidatus Magasanikbacteria bacterium CG10_big_fil_rev_8_21_14_0_10_47_10 TaxID=1974652 RepID=A0A2H0TPN7_9BACT|nr:MAG: hypothetical protein COU35_04150 [Candidatus Magasanikbacteria bacterium CG10_big_fil_rev_8_21_14_0_10_47_10]
MIKKLLIISVSAGAGHVKVAQALEKQAQLLYPGMMAKHIDMMDYVSAGVRTSMIEAYKQLIHRAPALWGYLYDVSDNEKKLSRVDRVIQMLNAITARRLYDFVQKFQPDHIVCTHFFPSQALTRTDSFDRGCPMSVVVTDYGMHSYWTACDADYFFVATPQVKKEVLQKGVLSKRVFVTGIPVDPAFFEKKQKISLKKEYKLTLKKPVLLISSGGHGLMRADQIVHAIDTTDRYTIVAVAGRNAVLLKKLKEIGSKRAGLVSVGWTNKMDEYMRMADVIIGKPGGSTVTEALMLGKPFIAINPIPGQEEKNVLFLKKSGMGYIAREKKELNGLITRALRKGKSLRPRKKNPAQRVLEIIAK